MLIQPTGSGKSLALMLATLARRGVGRSGTDRDKVRLLLLVEPTNPLLHSIGAGFRGLSRVKYFRFCGGARPGDVRKRVNDLAPGTSAVLAFSAPKLWRCRDELNELCGLGTHA